MNWNNDFEDYKSKYLDLYDKVKNDHTKQKTSILDDIDFELELIHQDEGVCGGICEWNDRVIVEINKKSVDFRDLKKR